MQQNVDMMPRKGLTGSRDSYAYSGSLEVKGEDFILESDQIIIKHGEVAFMFSGSDGDGKFTAEGIAKLAGNGSYVSTQINVNYLGFDSDDRATIQFTVIKPTPKKIRCQVEGKWVQGDTWLFSGNLRKFDPKQR